MGRGKHHIGDFLPPDELERFMETFTVGAVYVSLVLQALKEGRESDLCDTNSLCFSCTAGFEGRP